MKISEQKHGGVYANKTEVNATRKKYKSLKKQILEKDPNHFKKGTKIALVAVPDRDNPGKTWGRVSAWGVTNANMAYFVNECMLDPNHPDRQDAMFSENQHLFALDNPFFNVRLHGDKAFVAEGFEDYPVVCLSFFASYLFAIRYGLKIPKKQDWEKFAERLTTPLSGEKFTFAGTDDLNTCGWYKENSNNSIQPFGELNPLMPTIPIYDIVGNVHKWLDNDDAPDRYEFARTELFEDKEINGVFKTAEESLKEFIKFDKLVVPEELQDEVVVILDLETGQFEAFDYQLIEE